MQEGISCPVEIEARGKTVQKTRSPEFRARERELYKIRASDIEYKKKRNLQKKEWLNKNPLKKAAYNEHSKAWAASPVVRARCREYAKRPEARTKKRSYWKTYYRTNINARLMHIQRAVFWNHLKKGKVIAVKHFLGCSYTFLQNHLESQFTNGMSWLNHGTLWEIDHIQPLSSFDLSDINQCKLAWNWQNLQPLTREANNKKRARITVPQLHLPLVLDA